MLISLRCKSLRCKALWPLASDQVGESIETKLALKHATLKGPGLHHCIGLMGTLRSLDCLIERDDRGEPAWRIADCISANVNRQCGSSLFVRQRRCALRREALSHELLFFQGHRRVFP